MQTIIRINDIFKARQAVRAAVKVPTNLVLWKGRRYVPNGRVHNLAHWIGESRTDTLYKVMMDEVCNFDHTFR